MWKILARIVFCCGLSATPASAEPERPNIILIISDDHAFTDYGFMGHGIVETPHLDRISSQGLLYTRGYVMPVCSPSLASLLTGKLPHQHGITGNDLARGAPQLGAKPADRDPLLRQLLGNSLVLPQALSEAGYLTFQTGKLWNATYKDVGFTHGMTRTPGRHGGEGLAIGREGMQPIYDFIETARGAEKPFFIWHAPFMPHDPHTPPADILAKYTGKGPTPEAEKYHAMVEWFDQTCGELDEYLATNGLADNTVILYLADNGWNAAKGYAGGRAKLSPYETGVRSPMFVRWPGKVKPLRDDETLASILDFAPTILKLAGIHAPADLTGIGLLDRQAMTARKSVFVEAYTHDIADLTKPARSLIARVVIDGWSKLILPGPAKPDRPFATVPGKPELYDLKSDPLEKNDLSASRPGEVERLMAIQDAAWKAE
jgi:arylsulfatase A-like enzyme